MRRWWWYSPGLTKFPSISYKKSSHHLFVWEPAKTGTGVGKRGGGDTSELEESGHWFSVIISGNFFILLLYLPKHLSYLGTSPKASQFHTNIYRNIQYSQEVCNVQFFCCCCEEANIIQAKQQFLKTPLSGRKYLYEVVYCALQLGRVIFTFCDFQKWAYC